MHACVDVTHLQSLSWVLSSACRDESLEVGELVGNEGMSCYCRHLKGGREREGGRVRGKEGGKKREVENVWGGQELVKVLMR